MQRYRLEDLNDQHPIGDFACGDDEIDAYLHNGRALIYLTQKTTNRPDR
jgi:hypothetical protein